MSVRRIVLGIEFIGQVVPLVDLVISVKLSSRFLFDISSPFGNAFFKVLDDLCCASLFGRPCECIHQNVSLSLRAKAETKLQLKKVQSVGRVLHFRLRVHLATHFINGKLSAESGQSSPLGDEEWTVFGSAGWELPTVYRSSSSYQSC